MTIATGTRLGRYQIRCQIGADSMGVYLARKTELERSVAFKILPVDINHVGTHNPQPVATRNSQPVGTQ